MYLESFSNHEINFIIKEINVFRRNDKRRFVEQIVEWNENLTVKISFVVLWLRQTTKPMKSFVISSVSCPNKRTWTQLLANMSIKAFWYKAYVSSKFNAHRIWKANCLCEDKLQCACSLTNNYQQAVNNATTTCARNCLNSVVCNKYWHSYKSN